MIATMSLQELSWDVLSIRSVEIVQLRDEILFSAAFPLPVMNAYLFQLPRHASGVAL